MTLKLVSFTGDQDFELTPDHIYVVGRAVTSDIPIFDPTISRRHAELKPSKAGVHLKDLGSSNGTFINGERVTEGTLEPGDSVTFGKVVFQLKSPDQTGRHSATGQNQPHPGGTIVKQVAMSVVMPAALVEEVAASVVGHHEAGAGQLKVAAATTAERNAKKLSLLLEVSQKLSGELDLDKLLGRVVETTFDVMGVDRVSVLLSTDSGELVPRVSKSRLGDGSSHHVPRSIARKAVEERVAILTDNAVADDRFKGGQSILLQSVRSAMCIPLMASAEQVLGILYVDNLTATNSFNDEDLQFLIAFGGLAAIAIKNSRFAEQIQREAMVRSNFERYFAPNVAAEIAQQQGAVKLGGDKRPVTILFSDIRGFTSMSEHMSPDSIASLLSDYFTEMVDIIFTHGGTLDKFIGDAIMALWGAPIPHAEDPDQAVQAAIAMQRAIHGLNAKWTAEGRPSISVGIGINYGDTFAGNIGSHLRLEYTVIGDAVNVASRLCSNAKGGEILISDPLHQVLKEKPPVVARDPLSVKNRAQAVSVWSVKV
ncbi:MAG TPA: adenylate/guanylate cyclase domain-containing protein [Gemmatimonadales bacterium]|nr:adenylate/guanylate cyclase domain-containing protein [Gemmatimonadales bacterium]